jgi:hypothetical protein
MANYKTKHHFIDLADNQTRTPANTVYAGATLNGVTTKEFAILQLCDAGGNVLAAEEIRFEPMEVISGLSEV